MKLEDVDVVGLQAFQTALADIDDLLSRPDFIEGIHQKLDLGRDDKPIAPVFERLANDHLAVAVAVASGRI